MNKNTVTVMQTSASLRWRVTGKGYVIKLKELRSVDKWIMQLLNHIYTCAVYLFSYRLIYGYFFHQTAIIFVHRLNSNS